MNILAPRRVHPPIERSFMILALIVFFCSYYLVVAGLMAGWKGSVKERKRGLIVDDNMISVIIPARNEEECIGILLMDLQRQEYRDFEVIVVDDHSDDGTMQMVLAAVKPGQNIKVITSSGTGKKLALTTGIRAAQGKIIVTTDSDCRVSPAWLAIINQNFQDQKTNMVLGCVKMEENNTFLGSLQVMEFSSLIGSGIATLFFGFPTLCNGANLAFRKDVFDAVGGYSDNFHIPSGDDEFLLQKVFKKYPTGVHFMGTSGAVVRTKPQRTGKDFINQRIRWAGKWRYNRTVSKTLLAIYIFLFQLVTILLPVLVLNGWLSFPVAVGLWGAKVFVEFLFLWSVSRSLKSKWNWPSFTMLQLLYPFYVVLVGVFCNFRSFTWKERRLRSGKEKTG